MNDELNMKNGKVAKLLMIIFFVIFIVGIVYISLYYYRSYKSKKNNENILDEIEIYTPNEPTNIIPERVLKLRKLKEENNDVVAWIEIEGTNINYPVLQGKDNDFYLTHNYKKEKAEGGSLFLDKDFDIVNGSSNYLIYGHRMKNGTMFEDLMKYADQNFYNDHKTIKFATQQEESIYEILAVFYSRVYYKSEQNVFRYYYFVNANNEQEYNDFVNNSKRASIYATNVHAQYGDQLLTLSTCEYSQEDGRFVVVARKIK